jgi:predicted ATPase/DNA-binding SARP family transcriptional activator
VATTFDVLGPLRIVADGTEINLPGHLQRRLLAALLLHHGRVVSVDRLTELVWPDGDAPEGSAALQSLVFRLRQRVSDLRIEFRPPGYVAQVDESALMSVRFEHAVQSAASLRTTDPSAALRAVEQALAMWRGDPYGDLVESDDGRIEIERLEESWLRANEERFELLVSLGRQVEVVAELEAFASRHPLRERLRLALIDALSATGRRADALRVYDDYRRTLAEELGVAPSVSLRSRHERLLQEDDLEPAAEPAPVARRQTVRRPTSPLIGRADVLAEIERLVEHVRLVTLIGPGGVGKTRLVIEACHLLADRFDNVVFCDLSMASSESVIDVVIEAVGIETRAGQEAGERLEAVLRHERCLLVLDNCEHVIDAAATVTERLLQLTDRLVVVATTRERLAVDGEHLLAVPPLELDGVGSPAVALFLERANAVAPGFRADADTIEGVVALCRRLDGLPLAIELAAARLQSLRLDEIAAGLDESLAVLRSGRRTVERHRSVEAALQWSFDLLDDGDRAALHAAAMFSTAFEAGDVATALGVGNIEARERMAALVERSLAGRQSSGRFYLLDIVRQFARQRIDPAVRTRLQSGFADAIGATAERLAAEARTAHDDSPIRAFNALAGDFRSVVARSLAEGRVEIALRITLSVRDLALNTLSPDLMRMAADVAEAADALDHPLTADAYAMAAQGAWKRGDLAEMRQLLIKAEAAVDRLHIGDRYDVLGTIATELLAHGRMAEAAALYRRGNQTPEAVDDPLRLAEGGGTMAICLSYAHDPTAIAEADRLLDAVVPIGGDVAGAWCYYAAGECRIDSDPAMARAHLTRAVELARNGGGSFVEAVAGASLASLDVRLGDTRSAIDTYRWLLPLWLRAGVRSPFWTAMRWVTRLLCDIDQPIAAARLLGAIGGPDADFEHLGDDRQHMQAISAALLEQLGEETYASEYARGAKLDDAAATELVMTAFA